jgi:hypothetical protein
MTGPQVTKQTLIASSRHAAADPQRCRPVI